MFTGIITDVGEVASREDGRFTIRTRYASRQSRCRRLDGLRRMLPDHDLGCEADGSGALFTVDISNETRAKTTIGDWQPGRRINLERSLRAGDELGGHIVTGHVDGLARIVDVRADGESRRFSFEVPDHLAPFIAPKGSVALDGVSLTVNEVSDNRFGDQPHPAHLDGDDLGGQNPRTVGQPGGRPVCALHRAALGVPPVTP